MKRKKLEKKQRKAGQVVDTMRDDKEEDRWLPSFAQLEDVPFGQTNDAPPDLRLPRLKKHGEGQKPNQKQRKERKERSQQSSAQKDEWERLRQETQKAYQLMKERQRSQKK